MKLSKDILGLSAEYAVASELCRRIIYAQLTLGTHKRTDILAETEKGMLRISVKGKQGREWPFCKGIDGKHIVLVFVDFENKMMNPPSFYILTVEDWKRLLGTEEVKRQNTETPDIKAGMIEEHKDKWEKIEKELDNFVSV